MTDWHQFVAVTAILMALLRISYQLGRIATVLEALRDTP